MLKEYLIFLVNYFKSLKFKFCHCDLAEIINKKIQTKVDNCFYNNKNNL